MNWIVVLALEAATIFCIVKFSWFRNCLLVVIVIAGAIYYMDFQKRNWHPRYILMEPPKEFEFTNIEFSDPFAQSGSNEIKGRVKNNSKTYALAEMCLNVQLVANYNDRTEIIGSDEVYISLDVPPQQTRDFIAHPHFRTLNAPKGKCDWLCSVGPIKVVDSEYHTLMN